MFIICWEKTHEFSFFCYWPADWHHYLLLLTGGLAESAAWTLSRKVSSVSSGNSTLRCSQHWRTSWAVSGPVLDRLLCAMADHVALSSSCCSAMLSSCLTGLPGGAERSVHFSFLLVSSPRADWLSNHSAEVCTVLPFYVGIYEHCAGIKVLIIMSDDTLSAQCYKVRLSDAQ